MKQRICLFTAHTPNTGGGAVILKSLIANVPEISVEWFYISDKPAKNYEQGHIGKSIMGGPPIKDIISTWLMLADKKVNRINEIVDVLLDQDCDAYWIVSHNEGLRIALELSRCQNKRPVHLTVHDDWSGALSARSKRYYLMGGLAKRMTVATVRSVSSVDLISKGMQDYYFNISGISGEICHRYLPESTLQSSVIPVNSGSDQLSVGHIGSIYDKADFTRFLYLLIEFGNLNKKKITVNMWGYHPEKNDFPESLIQILRIHDDLPEEAVIPELTKCNFVYAMYPMDESLALFSQTSLPTKLSSYIQAGRPIFGHGPKTSSLSEFINETGLGVLWTSSFNTETGLDLIGKILLLNSKTEQWQAARTRYFGENNLRVVRDVFTMH